MAGIEILRRSEGRTAVPEQRVISSVACGEGGSFAIGAVGGHGVERVGDGEDARAERDLFAAEAAWIAGAIEALLVGVDDFGGFAEEGDFADHFVAALAVLAHDGHFFGVEPAGFEKDAVGGGDLADVVEEGAAGDDAELVGFDAHGAGEGDGVGGDAFGVAFGLLVAEVEGVAHGFEGDVVAALEVLHGGAEAAGAGLRRWLRGSGGRWCFVCGGGRARRRGETTASSWLRVRRA